MIEVEGLTKYYGTFPALENVSFRVPGDEIVAFLGPNGAGKSTTMKILTGYISPTRGKATIDGMDVVRHPLAIRRRIGYLPETTPLYYDMQVDEFLHFTARLRQIPRARRPGRLGWVAGICHLEPFWKKPIGLLSRGQKQRVGFAQAILHDPKVLILDEPTAGLDPNQIVEIRELIKRFAERKTIILSTHILQEVDAMAGHIIVVHKGRIVADTSAVELRNAHGSLENAFRALTRNGAPQEEGASDG
ncbi:MAG: ABC transporter ATP-binding protein [Planctomycetota bacterium]|jgi:ABC-2 type transport system ATP-binding protein